MASHIEFMKSIIYKPTYTLKKDMSATKGGRRSSQLVTEIIDCIIADIGEEKVLIAGTPMKIKRLYAICSDSGDYADVGWVINAEATRCMNCAETFGIYCYAHHCKSCGNVVCDKCSRSTAHIYELQDLGPLRVCDMCYWGQDPVYASKKAVQQLRDSITAASAAAAIRPSDLDAAAAEQAAYERKQAEKLQREREIKEQKHAEIVRQAMPRLATTLKTDGAAVASSRGPASITPFKPAAAAAIATSSVNTNGESSSGGVGSGAVVGSTVNPMRSASMLSTVSNTSTGDGSRAGPGLGPGLKTSTSAAAPATTSSRPPVANVSNPLRSGSSGSMLEVSSCAGGGAEVFPGHEFGGGGGEEEEEMEMDGEEVSAIVNGRRPSMIDREELETFDRMARARTDKLRSFGPLSLVTPDPGFVIKSKRKDLTKVFINVCSHTAVPYRVDPEPDGGTVPSGFGHSGGNVDPSKQLYLLVGPPLEYQNEKDQSYCILYDILVHPDEIKVIFLDPTGAARKRLTSQALDLIGTYFGEHLDPHAKYPSISNNYKGRDKSGKTRVLPFAVPAKDAFYILEQMHTTPEDVPFASPSTSELLDQSTTTAPAAGAPAAATGAASSGKKRSIFGGKKEADQGQGQGRSLSAESAATAASDSYMDPRMSTAQNSCRDCLASLDSIQQNMDSTMKVTVKARAEAGAVAGSRQGRLAANDFNKVLDDLKACQYGFSDMLLYPDPGFVVAARRSQKGQRIFINVCHHPLVGLVSIKQQLDQEQGRGGGGGGASGAQAVATASAAMWHDRAAPFIVGAINNKFEGNMEELERRGSSGSSSGGGGGGGVAITIDVVVPSSVLIAAMHDASGDAMDKLVIDLLEGLATLDVEFDSNFTLPVVPGGYVGGFDQTGQPNVRTAAVDGDVVNILPVINLTEEEKEQFDVDFVGKFSKQGHGYKTWKARLVHLVEDHLKYFDLKSIYKGEFVIKDCEVDTSISREECSAPPSTYPFKLTNCSTAGEYMFCYVESEQLRDIFKLVIEAKTRQSSVRRDLIDVPAALTGWLTKQGHRFKTWKRRFFVLRVGTLKYYEKDGMASSGSAATSLGGVELRGAQVKVVLNTDGKKSKPSDKVKQQLEITDAAGDVLLVEAESADEKNMWFNALKKHIIFAAQHIQ